MQVYDCGQVVNTRMPLSSSDIIWYNDDAAQLGKIQRARADTM